PHEYQICNLNGHLIPLGELRAVCTNWTLRRRSSRIAAAASAQPKPWTFWYKPASEKSSTSRAEFSIGLTKWTLPCQNTEVQSKSAKKAKKRMSVFDEMLAHNARYAETFGLGHLQTPPVRKLVILTCMDSRMDLEQLLGLQVGDAHMIRNAGGLATDDAIRSLILSTHLLGTRAIAIIQHTECGLLSITDDQ